MRLTEKYRAYEANGLNEAYLTDALLGVKRAKE